MTLPLANKRIVVTRPRAQAADLCHKLTALGAAPILFPTIQIVPVPDPSALDAAIAQLATYDWIIFTSANGVAAFWERYDRSNDFSRSLPRVATIGPATAEAVRQRGISVTVVPAEHVAEALIQELGDVAGQRILIPRAETVREVLANELRAQGALVTEVVAYSTVPATPQADTLAELQRGVDVITFTSSSTARNFVPYAGLIGNAVVACIGPITAQTARDNGFSVQVVANDYTTDGLLTALVEYYSPS